MKKLLVALLGLISVAAYADNSVYITGNVGANTGFNYGTGYGDGTVRPNGGYFVGGNFGVNLNKYLALEAGYTNAWVTTPVTTPNSNPYYTQSFGMVDQAVRGTIALNDVFDLYGRLGLAWYDNTPNGAAISLNNLGVLYGMGAEFNLSKSWALTAEYWGATGSTAFSSGNIQGGFKFSF